MFCVTRSKASFAMQAIVRDAWPTGALFRQRIPCALLQARRSFSEEQPREESERDRVRRALGEDSPLWPTLGVRPEASAKELKTAFNRTALRMHPDHSQAPNAEEMFRALRTDYEFALVRAERRAEKDDRRTKTNLGGRQRKDMINARRRGKMIQGEDDGWGGRR